MPRFHKLPNIVALRKGLRSSATDAERTLWYFLRNRQFYGKKFRRQYGINRYIVDFYCPELKLAIELDGSQHFSAEQVVRDQERTADLESYGLQVIRFTNDDVFFNMDGVLEVLADIVLHPTRYAGRPSSSLRRG